MCVLTRRYILDIINLAMWNTPTQNSLKRVKRVVALCADAVKTPAGEPNTSVSFFSTQRSLSDESDAVVTSSLLAVCPCSALIGDIEKDALYPLTLSVTALCWTCRRFTSTVMWQNSQTSNVHCSFVAVPLWVSVCK